MDLRATFIPTSALLLQNTSRHPTVSRKRLPFKPRTPLRLSPRAELAQSAPTDSTRIPEEEALDPGSGSVVIAPSVKLAAAVMALGGFCIYQGDGWLVPGFPVLLLGLLLSVQSFRLRFVFGPTKFSVAQKKGGRLEIMRGYAYDQITNWEFWWKPVPILAYFKETESYNGRGSVHFLPILCSGEQLLEQLKKQTPHLDKSEYS